MFGPKYSTADPGVDPLEQYRAEKKEVRERANQGRWVWYLLILVCGISFFWAWRKARAGNNQATGQEQAIEIMVNQTMDALAAIPTDTPIPTETTSPTPTLVISSTPTETPTPPPTQTPWVETSVVYHNIEIEKEKIVIHTVIVPQPILITVVVTATYTPIMPATETITPTLTETPTLTPTATATP